jgi:hypothetical protein
MGLSGGSIEPGDYDTGLFDDLFIQLELNIPAVQILQSRCPSIFAI